MTGEGFAGMTFVSVLVRGAVMPAKARIHGVMWFLFEMGGNLCGDVLLGWSLWGEIPAFGGMTGGECGDGNLGGV
ncbi:hypothetical protein TH1_13695 [Thalassospira lucentensis MCCC 1A00383 = DSM 14000]|nr:hypothetical protein TH1_13695 [Thalassospira lucentensis MCCC 1A00383 = DSM 14000]